MCTLTYLPNATGFTLTHNRDERNDREATKGFVTKKINKNEVYFPQDLEGTGTWFSIHEKYTVCVLNGGSKDYVPKPKYRQSRGLVPLHLYDYKTVEYFHAYYNFDDLEPFTLIIKSIDKLYKLVHDWNETKLFTLDASKPHIWSSTKLYSPEIRAKREQWFQNWMNTTLDYSAATIRDFHLTAGDGDVSNSLQMSRWGILKTVSLTQVYTHQQKAQLYYHNFEYKAPELLELPT